jgi:tetratricopeptide (TPR) repeat protein
VRLEWRTGEVLEELRKDELGPLAGEVARHYTEGIAVGDPRTAGAWWLRAGAHAEERLAYEEAIRSYEMALRASPGAGGASDLDRVDVLIALGRAADRAGNRTLCQASCLEAASLARGADDAERLAGAAISLHGSLGPHSDAAVLTVMEEAIDALRARPDSPAQQGLLAELLAGLSGYLSNVRQERSAALAGEALDSARRSADPRGLALALMSSAQTYALPHDELTARLRETVALADATGDRQIVLAARSNLMAGALMWGDRDGFDRRLAEYAQVAAEARAPTPLVLSAIDHAGATALDGRYGDAMRQFGAALDRAARLGDPFLRSNIVGGMYPVRRELGQLAAAAGRARDAAAKQPEVIAAAVTLVRVLCEAGQLEEADERLHRLLEDPERLLSGYVRRCNLALLAESAEILGDGEVAARLNAWMIDELRFGVCVIAGPCAFHGAVHRYLGLLASTLGDADDAVEHHESALDLHERMRAGGWSARSRYDLARSLVERGHEGDKERATRLRAAALTRAEQLGMPRLLQELMTSEPGIGSPR